MSFVDLVREPKNVFFSDMTCVFMYYFRTKQWCDTCWVKDPIWMRFYQLIVLFQNKWKQKLPKLRLGPLYLPSFLQKIVLFWS